MLNLTLRTHLSYWCSTVRGDLVVKYWVYDNSEKITSTFYSNGTGNYYDTENGKQVTFSWTLINADMEIRLHIPNAGTIYYKNVDVSNTQFKFEKEDLGFDKQKNKVLFYGTYVYE